MINSLRKNLAFAVAVFIGISAILSFYFFYSQQKEFSKHQREFLLTLNAIETEAAMLNFSLLQNYIYAYNNNDKITATLKKLQTDFYNLVKNKLLLKQKYEPLQKNIGLLKNEIDATFKDIQRYLMLNASIKNSLLFLSGYESKLSRSHNEALLLQASKTIQSLLYARRMSDLSYISSKPTLPNSSKYPKEIQKFIKSYNLHIRYIITNLPQLLELKKKIESNKIATYANRIKVDFSKLSVKDFAILNTFAVALFLVFSTTFIYLVYVLLRYKKEHSKLLKTTKSLQYSLLHDILTGLKNRIAFDAEKKKLQHPLVILINIDRFKDINDVFGNDVGNQLLKEIAKLLTRTVETEQNFVEAYRIGGDEFCLLFAQISQQNAYRIAQNIEKIVSHTDFTIQDNDINLSISIAVSDTSPLLESADLALKLIKKQRSPKIIIYNENLGLQRIAQKNIETIQFVKKAIEHNHVTVFFQPIVNLKTMEVEKFESLVRIVEDDKVYTPFHFLDIVKKTHLYQSITHIVVEKTFHAAAKFPQHRFSINLSVSDILNDDLVEEIFTLFQKHILVANRIDVELLESEELYAHDKVKSFIDRVHSFGSLILIDDFGSGYSNFAYFADFEIDIIKIDGSIIQEITTNKRKRHMLESITMFAKSLNLKIVAEFVDDAEIVKILKELDIEFAQGYYFSPPLPEPSISLNKS